MRWIHAQCKWVARLERRYIHDFLLMRLPLCNSSIHDSGAYALGSTRAHGAFSSACSSRTVSHCSGKREMRSVAAWSAVKTLSSRLHATSDLVACSALQQGSASHRLLALPLWSYTGDNLQARQYSCQGIKQQHSAEVTGALSQCEWNVTSCMRKHVAMGAWHAQSFISAGM
jgi:hypothetical protein